MHCSKPKIIRLALDLLLYLSIGIVVFISAYKPIAAPYSYVTCDDPSTRKPYKESTVSDVTLVFISLGLPLVVVTVLEWAVPLPSNGASPLRQGLRRSGRYLWDFFVGGLAMYYITEVFKVTSGEARPFFWSVCSPNLTAEQCQQSYVSVTGRDCTNPLGLSKRRVLESMKSFPSGHASVSVFSCIFLIVYIKQRLWNKCSRLLVLWLHLALITWVIVCCQSRIWDNHHHWWDVLAGGLIGGFGALGTLHYLSNWFIRENCLENEARTGEPEYLRHHSRSQTSVKRLVSTASETENHADHRLDNRELSDINGVP